MKKEYTNPIIEIFSIENEDVLTASLLFGGFRPGDTNVSVDDILDL